MADELFIIVVIVVLAIIFLWGGKRIPDFARQAGKMTKDVQQAYKEGGLSSSTEQKQNNDGSLLDLARRLGIETEGRTRKEISEEIITRVKASA
jgi:sec-independent protein translocase protein TatA